MREDFMEMAKRFKHEERKPAKRVKRGNPVYSDVRLPQLLEKAAFYTSDDVSIRDIYEHRFYLLSRTVLGERACRAYEDDAVCAAYTRLPIEHYLHYGNISVITEEQVNRLLRSAKKTEGVFWFDDLYQCWIWFHYPNPVSIFKKMLDRFVKLEHIAKLNSDAAAVFEFEKGIVSVDDLYKVYRSAIEDPRIQQPIENQFQYEEAGSFLAINSDAHDSRLAKLNERPAPTTYEGLYKYVFNDLFRINDLASVLEPYDLYRKMGKEYVRKEYKAAGIHLSDVIDDPSLIGIRKGGR